MSFVSIAFFIFLPLVILLYFLLPRIIKPFFLLLASYVFYMFANPYLIFIIIGVTAISYLSSIGIEKAKGQKAKKAILIGSIILILGVLIFFKYFNFLIKTATDFLNLFSLGLSSPTFDIILPIGISFYTFQALSYVVDVYQEQYEAEKNPLYYALYISFFPQLIAGPIERPNDLIPQLKENHRFDKENFFQGLKILLIGYFYKCCVADVIGIYVDSVYANIGSATSLSMLMASLLFIVQLYCDFNGDSEIARGVAKIMGIELTRNFDYPFGSRSFTEFWSKWHITLSRWFNDYLYLPLSFKAMDSKYPLLRHILHIFIVFGLCGLWHGANLTFLLWGLFAALIISIEAVLKDPMNHFYKVHPKVKESIWLLVLQKIKLFLILAISGILFRCQNVAEIGEAFSRLFAGYPTPYFQATYNSLALIPLAIIKIALVLLSLPIIKIWATDNLLPLKGLDNNRKIVNIINGGLCVLLVALCVLNLFHSTGTSLFIYFQF